MIYPSLRRLANPLGWTPLHPQWLMRGKHASRYRWIASFIPPGLLLDVGCGNTPLRKELPATVEYIGLDYPITTKLGYSGHPNVFGDGQKLPFGDCAFDAVTLLDVLEHLPRPDLALAEAVRVTRPGGLIVCQTPFMYPLHDRPHDYQRWTESGIRQFAAANAMTLEVLDSYGNAVETATTLSCLALAKAMLTAYEKRQLGLLLLPLILISIPCINILGWLLARFLNERDFMPLGYTAIFRKDDAEGALPGGASRA